MSFVFHAMLAFACVAFILGAALREPHALLTRIFVIIAAAGVAIVVLADIVDDMAGSGTFTVASGWEMHTRRRSDINVGIETVMTFAMPLVAFYAGCVLRKLVDAWRGE